MPVPRMSQVRADTGVNIVLKADQPSGKLTTGQIAGILTQGDHPRGIKVRLTNGQIGRVQSLSSSTAPDSSQPSLSQGETSSAQFNSTRPTDSSKSGRLGMAHDMRHDGYDYASKGDTSSLFDYVRPAKQRKSAKTKIKSEGSEGEGSAQKDLEAEFPKLDSALVAAILADHQSVVEARGVLKGLS